MDTINNYCVYKHTSPSGKCYIGITCQKPEERWGYNGYNYIIKKKDGKQKHPYFANAILKYGWDNIKHEILHSGLSKAEACHKEQEYIKIYKSGGKSYNITDGGEGSSGYKFSPEIIEKIAASHRGIKQSQETIAKRVAKNIGKTRTDEQKMKTSKPIIQYDLQGNFISEYFGINEASRQTGINKAHIGDCCNKIKNRKSAGGFLWTFKDDPIPSFYKETHSRKKVRCIFSNGTIKQWDSMKEAMKECNITRYKLQKYCNEKIEDDNGNTWEWICDSTAHPQARELEIPLKEEFIKRNLI